MSEPASISPHRERLAQLLRLPEPELPLAHACLLIAAEEYPDLDVDYYLSRLSQIANSAAESARTQSSIGGRLEALRYLLFEELRFRGNVKEYFDPENSYLNRVLERRMGIPITLSVVYLEVGWQLDIPLAGVGFPGHFLVKCVGDGSDTLIDPFGGGVPIDESECLRKLIDLYGPAAELRPEYFRVIPKNQILTRVLNNLKNIHLSANDHRRALGTVEMLLMINPRAYNELRDRGFLHFQLECYSAAVEDLENYLQHCPRCRDAEHIQDCLIRIRRMIH